LTLGRRTGDGRASMRAACRAGAGKSGGNVEGGCDRQFVEVQLTGSEGGVGGGPRAKRASGWGAADGRSRCWTEEGDRGRRRRAIRTAGFGELHGAGWAALGLATTRRWQWLFRAGKWHTDSGGGRNSTDKRDSSAGRQDQAKETQGRGRQGRVRPGVPPPPGGRQTRGRRRRGLMPERRNARARTATVLVGGGGGAIGVTVLQSKGSRPYVPAQSVWREQRTP